MTMKNFYLLFLLFLSIFSFAQTPQKLSFQAVIRDAANAPAANKSVKLRISILKNNATGTVIYSETHETVSNSFGLVTLNIGTGTPTLGTFSTVPWGVDTFFLKTEADPGTNTFSLVSNTQLLSVPYSLYSNKTKLAENASEAEHANISDIAKTADGLVNVSWDPNGELSADQSGLALDYGYTSITSAVRNAYVEDTAGLWEEIIIPKTGTYLVFYRVRVVDDYPHAVTGINSDHSAITELYNSTSKKVLHRIESWNANVSSSDYLATVARVLVLRMAVAKLQAGDKIVFRHQMKTFLGADANSENPPPTSSWHAEMHNYQFIRIGD